MNNNPNPLQSTFKIPLPFSSNKFLTNKNISKNIVNNSCDTTTTTATASSTDKPSAVKSFQSCNDLPLTSISSSSSSLLNNTSPYYHQQQHQSINSTIINDSTYRQNKRRSMSCPQITVIYREVACGSDPLYNMHDASVQTMDYRPLNIPPPNNKSSSTLSTSSALHRRSQSNNMIKQSSVRQSMSRPISVTKSSSSSDQQQQIPIQCWNCERLKEQLDIFNKLHKEFNETKKIVKEVKDRRKQMVTSAENAITNVKLVMQTARPSLRQCIIPKIDQSNQTNSSWIEQSQNLVNDNTKLRLQNQKLFDELRETYKENHSLKEVENELNHYRQQLFDLQTEMEQVNLLNSSQNQQIIQLQKSIEQFKEEEKMQLNHLQNEIENEKIKNGKIQKEFELKMNEMKNEKSKEIGTLMDKLIHERNLVASYCMEKEKGLYSLEMSNNQVCQLKEEIVRLEKQVKNYRTFILRKSGEIGKDTCLRCIEMRFEVETSSQQHSEQSSSSSVVLVNLNRENLNPASVLK